MSKNRVQEGTVVQETINLRRKELVEELKSGVSSLFNLLEKSDSEGQKQSTKFSIEMCLSELYRSVAYWESHLYEVSNTIIQQENQENNVKDQTKNS